MGFYLLVHLLNSKLLLFIGNLVHWVMRVTRETNALIDIQSGSGTSRLHPRSSGLSDLLIEPQSGIDIVGILWMRLREKYTESSSVFECLACSLGLIWKHRMSCITQDAASAHLPAIIWLVHKESPWLDVLGVLEQSKKRRVEVEKRRNQLFARCRLVPAFASVVTLLCREEAIKGVDFAFTAWRENNLVNVFSAPEFNGGVG